MQVEVIQGMPEAEYRARPEVSQSQLKAFRLPTQAHAAEELKPRDEDEAEKDHFLDGQALHGILLENKHPRLAKVTTKKNPKQDGDGILLSPHHYEIVFGMAAGITRNGEAAALLDDRIETEVSIFWDGWKARLDGVCPLGVIDLKSCRKLLTKRNFSAQIEEFGYAIQAAHYLEAAAVAGLPCEDFRFICVENFPPYCSRVFRLGHRSLELGRQELVELRTRYLAWKSSERAHGYPEVDQEIELPRWRLRQEEEGEE